MRINGKIVDLNGSATFYQDRFNGGTFFPHLAQAIRHAVGTPSSRQLYAASIVTQSGQQFGWAEISLLHDHLRDDATRPRDVVPPAPALALADAPGGAASTKSGTSPRPQELGKQTP